MRKTKTIFKGKRVLVFGLGLLGGGVATTNWLLSQGARVTVTDLKNFEQLEPAVRRVEDYLKKHASDGRVYEKIKARLTWALGGHSNSLIDGADIIVVNPDVAERNPYIQRALKNGKIVCNEGTIFFDNWKGKIIGVTGTRGKTTTVNWAHHFIQPSILTGNSIAKPFLSVLTESGKAPWAITELPSFILERFDTGKSPHIAVITNIYRDHLNRHGTMDEYVRAKSNIFQDQEKNDWLILNQDNGEWTSWLLEQKPRGNVRYFSLKPLPLDLEGIWYDRHVVWERRAGHEQIVLELGDFEKEWGMHNVSNFLASSLAAHLAGVKWPAIQARLTSVPQVPYRQETIYHDAKVRIINDTTATSPEGSLAALDRFSGPGCILITGGTDRELDYSSWAEIIKERMRKNDIILLEGSATQKMRLALGSWSKGIRAYPSLQKAVLAALTRSKLFIKSTILFSPAAKSFELFENEYDRGRQFNELINTWIKR